MAVGVYFHPVSMTKEQYEQIISELKAAGVEPPAGRLHHVAFGENPVQVFDIWESQEIFESFVPMLLPILERIGVDPGQPSIEQIVNVIH